MDTITQSSKPSKADWTRFAESRRTQASCEHCDWDSGPWEDSEQGAVELLAHHLRAHPDEKAPLAEARPDLAERAQARVAA